jgi:two-component system, cell cycle sensor histidine kinase and response regulator CckA
MWELTFRRAGASLLTMPNILLVDDEPDLRRALRRLLARKGWDVVEAGSVAEGLEVVGRGGVDAVICDIMMPGGSGIDFYDEAIKRDPGMARRIVFLTGAAEEPEVLQKVEARGTPLLNKLYELDLAIDAVTVALLGRG